MKEVKIYTIVSDQLSPPITGESFCTDMVRHSDYADLEEKCAALAAENAGLKKSEVEFNEYCRRECEDVGDTWVDDFTETPATDAFLAEVRASARNEGINYAASRLAASFNHGFLDKPVSEVLDVTRMILSAKEDLANDPLPADDGLSGEYAEKSIEEWAAQLRKGDAQ
ncbi:hypothetical protein ELQ57_13670 [Salmonella enterica subsp. enterica serovar Teko]|nr:hypothetical protein [Salmonella enterica subsp. enterica serovar Teko]EAQ5174938.1 hypothetical protein [Salmonella enterica]EBH8913014.1 hypothetical protein [Salmonella enterica subsp. enterica serovar Teko]EBY9653186.1 hypothetical protein [Salmonella enterica subsp. enterica serovar Teko]ECA4783606.1 hypothetical protein [Salmonella enterica subsp. enterica serovar Teko]